MPEISASQIGMLRTRSGPKRSIRPTVSPNRLISTSSPNRITRGSRSISSTSASLIAWIIRFFAMGSSGKHEIGGGRGIGPGGGRGEGDGVRDLACHVRLDRVERRAIGGAGRKQPVAEAEDRVVLPPRFDLVLLAIGLAEEGHLVFDMAAQPVGGAFEQRRPEP